MPKYIKIADVNGTNVYYSDTITGEKLTPAEYARYVAAQEDTSERGQILAKLNESDRSLVESFESLLGDFKMACIAAGIEEMATAGNTENLEKTARLLGLTEAQAREFCRGL